MTHIWVRFVLSEAQEICRDGQISNIRQRIAVAQLPCPLGNSGPDVFVKVTGICQPVTLRNDPPDNAVESENMSAILVPSIAICPHLTRTLFIHSIYNGAGCPCDDALNPLSHSCRVPRRPSVQICHLITVLILLLLYLLVSAFSGTTDCARLPSSPTGHAANALWC